MMVLSLGDAKQHLNLDSTVDDAELQTHIDAATELVSNLCGPFDADTFVETIHVCGGEVPLSHWPVTSITSVEPVWAWLQPVDVADLDVDEAGVVRRKSGLWFPEGQYRWKYTAGHAMVPASVTLAAAIIVQNLWETQRGTGGVAFAGGDDAAPGVYVPMMSGALPPRAAELLGPYMQLGGFA